MLEKSTHYFDPAQAKFDRLVFRIITDDNVRLANLRSGDIDFMHLVNPTHAASLRKEGKFDVASVPGIGYSAFNVNLRNKNGKPPSGARGRRHAARQRPARARGARADDRPRGAEPGGLGRASTRPTAPRSRR